MKNKIKIILVSLFSLIAIGINPCACLDIYEKAKTISYSNGMEVLNLNLFGTLLLFIFIYFFIKKNQKYLKGNIITRVISIVFSLLLIFGLSYKEYGNSSLIFNSLIFFILAVVMAIGYYFIIFILVNMIYDKIDKNEVKESKNKIILLFKKHPFIFSLIVILICWLPYIISFYPIILSPDPSYQIKQFFGIRTKYADYAVLLDENVVITNHHPVIHTLLLGGCLKLGGLLVNDNFGLFLYSFIQILILSFTLAYTIKYMLKNNVSSKFAFITLLIYSLVPMFPLYAMSGVKDVIFTSFIILYIIMLHKILNNKGKKLKFISYMLMIVLMLLIILFRNNGLYVILLSFPFLILSVKKDWKRLGLVFIITILLSSCYNNVILPAFKITPGSIREVLSIPFQQTARYVKYHEEDLSAEDKKIIDKVLGYNDLADRYDPELADPVKNNYNKYTTNEELKEYFKVWFKGLIKHPGTYIDATINNVYGYFYPNKLSWYVYYKYDTRILKDGFDYHYNSLNCVRDVLSSFAIAFPLIPILGLISNIGVATWIVILLTGYVIYRKKYKYIVVYLPALISILICIASPANTYFRYALPFVFSLPLMVSFVIDKNFRKS